MNKGRTIWTYINQLQSSTAMVIAMVIEVTLTFVVASASSRGRGSFLQQTTMRSNGWMDYLLTELRPHANSRQDREVVRGE